MNVERRKQELVMGLEQYNGRRNETMAVLVWENVKALSNQNNKIRDKKKVWGPH